MKLSPEREPAMLIYNRLRITFLCILVLILTAIIVSGCTFWLKDIDGKIYKTIIPDARVDQRVCFFLDQFSLNVKNLFSTHNDKHRLKVLLIETNTSFHNLVRNIGKNSRSNPVDIQDLYKKADKLAKEIKREMQKEESRKKKNDLKHASITCKNLVGLINDFCLLAKVRDP